MIPDETPYVLARARQIAEQQQISLATALRAAQREFDARPPVAGPIPIPPGFAAALGYHGEARYVSLHLWSEGELWVTDGVVSLCGDSRYFDLFVTAAPIRAYLRGADLRRTHRLLLDTERDALLVLPADQVVAMIAAHRGLTPSDMAHAEPPAVAPASDLAAALDLDTWEEIAGPSPAQLQASVAAAQERYAALVTWLTTQPIPDVLPVDVDALIRDVRADLGLTPPPAPPQDAPPTS